MRCLVYLCRSRPCSLRGAFRLGCDAMPHLPRPPLNPSSDGCPRLSTAIDYRRCILRVLLPVLIRCLKGQIESNYDETVDSFDDMNLKSELLRGTLPRSTPAGVKVSPSDMNAN